ncbi:styrene monooxygenase/indole monooxygenase family protein [Streptomyces xiangluensis]|uniref:Styrene monooxygenase/indole monooxygenase family protein n=1 Tax=Streptomyces xiangluensis TaxID=2665720 RepID=A0ABV8YQS5_9ACTN
MTNIGIIGTGVAGLHLALMLQQHQVPVTIYTDRTPSEVESGRLLNTVMHHHGTRERESELGVAHWALADTGWWTRYHSVLGAPGVFYRGNFSNASTALDYRLYLPRLERDFCERGGEVRPGKLGPADLEALSAQHDLLVVATGRGPLAEMFGRRADASSYDRPQRICLAALFNGVERPKPEGVSINASREVGELIEFPMLTAQGRVTAMLFESLPGGELEVLARTRYEEDPEAFDKLVLRALERHFPRVYERVRTEDFELLGPKDLLQGGVTPVVRNDYVRLDSGHFVLSIGDAHAAVDPVMGQGANVASYSAFVTGRAILDDLAFDEEFCRRVAAERAEVVMGATNVTNLYLEFPEHLRTLQAASARNQEIADAVAAAFATPQELWRIAKTPERVESFLRRFERA